MRRELTVDDSEGKTFTFQFDAGLIDIPPGLARVLLRILRKDAERRGIELADTAERDALAS